MLNNSILLPIHKVYQTSLKPLIVKGYGGVLSQNYGLFLSFSYPVPLHPQPYHITKFITYLPFTPIYPIYNTYTISTTHSPISNQIIYIFHNPSYAVIRYINRTITYISINSPQSITLNQSNLSQSTIIIYLIYHRKLNKLNTI